MDPEDRQVVRPEASQVAARLGVDELAERVRPAGDRAVDGMVRGQLEEPADRRAALVELAGRVQEARAVAGGRRPSRAISRDRPDPAECGVPFGGRRDDTPGGRRSRSSASRSSWVRRVAARPWIVGRRTVASPGGPSARPRAVDRRRGHGGCRSLASSTFGWSNGSIPRTTPAIAVATSQRTNSPARSIGSSRSIRMTGWPAASSAVSRSSAAVPSAVGAGPAERPRSAARRPDPRRRRRRVPSGSRSTGTIPTPCLPVLSAMSCSGPRAEAGDLRVGHEGQLVAAGHARLADREPELHARGWRRGSVVTAARRASPGAAEERVEVEPDERWPGRARRRSAPSTGRRCRAG